VVNLILFTLLFGSLWLFNPKPGEPTD